MINFHYTIDTTQKQFVRNAQKAARSHDGDCTVTPQETVVFVGDEGTYFFFHNGRGEFFGDESRFDAELKAYGMTEIEFLGYAQERKAS